MKYMKPHLFSTLSAALLVTACSSTSTPPAPTPPISSSTFSSTTATTAGGSDGVVVVKRTFAALQDENGSGAQALFAALGQSTAECMAERGLPYRIPTAGRHHEDVERFGDLEYASAHGFGAAEKALQHLDRS